MPGVALNIDPMLSWPVEPRTAQRPPGSSLGGGVGGQFAMPHRPNQSKTTFNSGHCQSFLLQNTSNNFQMPKDSHIGANFTKAHAGQLGHAVKNSSSSHWEILFFPATKMNSWSGSSSPKSNRKVTLYFLSWTHRGRYTSFGDVFMNC